MRDVLIKEFGMDFATLKPFFTVTCGCKTFVFRDKESLLVLLGQYLEDPLKLENDFNTRMGCPAACPTEVVRTGGTVTWNERAEAINNFDAFLQRAVASNYYQVPSDDLK